MDRARKPPARPRRLYRVTESPACSECGAATGDPHDDDCPNLLPRGGWVG